MEERKELFSKRVNSGSRTYFIDVKESKLGKKYLVISESREFEGEYEHLRVMVFKEDVEEFNQVLQEAIRFIRKGG